MFYSKSRSPRRFGQSAQLLFVLIPAVTTGGFAFNHFAGKSEPPTGTTAASVGRPRLAYEPRKGMVTSGQDMVYSLVPEWKPSASLTEIADCWKGVGYKLVAKIDSEAVAKALPEDAKIPLSLMKASLYHSEGDTAGASKELEKARATIEGNDALAVRWLYSIVYFQGVTALRRGENDNCIMCRGESSCILPISLAARHTNPDGSREAIKYFSEYLDQFPSDLEARWLLNLAHMTLGEHPDKVDPKHLISLERWSKSEFNIGRFRDVGHLVGVNRLNQAGGAVMEDFDGDGLLDLAVTSIDPTLPMSFYRNSGDGTFEDRSESAGVTGQLGGLFCVQTDYNNDGRMDIFIPRGAWVKHAMRPSLLRNNGDGTFADVTEEAGLLTAVNSNSAGWADYDNDGLVDLFICCERQPNRLYHNKGDGTFEEVGEKAGVAGNGNTFCKGSAWIDFDNDGDPDLFLNNLTSYAELYRNDGNGTFTRATMAMGIDGPRKGFSCWAWDYDNDGWLDIFATCYDHTTGDVVKGIMGEPHTRASNRLFRNLEGKGFKDMTVEAGLDMSFATMGSNIGDFDNDGFLDMYLATGDPDFATLVPNRMFKNVGGTRFSEITVSTGTGHLQKGHAVACGDWDRDGDTDLFVNTGGAVPGDQFHNVLFANPGQGNHWLTVKLVGKKTNRAAIGARVKAVTAGKTPLTVHRLISSGSSFGSNTLQQTLGLAGSDKVATLKIHWPTSGTTQVFHDIPCDQAIEVTEFAEDYRKLDWKPLPPPVEKADSAGMKMKRKSVPSPAAG